MKLRLIGTGYGECKIKKKSTKDFRHRGGVLVDERILIDAPSDIFEGAEELAFSDMFDSITDVIISHSHAGHFSPETVARLAAKRRIRVLASDAVLSMIQSSENIEKVSIRPYLQMEIGDYTLIPLPSNHETDMPSERCMNFVLSRDKSIFYALDGGCVNYGAWKVLSMLKLDAVIAECALELKPVSPLSMHHNGLEGVKFMRELFLSSGTASGGTRFLLTHIPTDKKRSVHEELSAAAAELGMTVAYDGYFFNV